MFENYDFIGQIPSVLNPNIIDLSLSHNSITGTIPYCLQHSQNINNS
jgi:hypothetical protein